jgi:hypothetical protein
VIQHKRGDPDSHHFTQMAQLPSLLGDFEEGDPDGFYELKPDEDDRFQSAFLCCCSAIYMWNHSRRMPCLDGDHIRSLLGTLLSATVEDANNHSALMALMYCNTEDKANWFSFLRNLCRLFPSIHFVMSDKDKGGKAACEELGLRMSICLKHVESF